MRISRRSFLSSTSLLALAPVLGCASRPAVRAHAKDRPIVIVPGTGGGAGAYERLIAALAARGRPAFAVQLAGMGERAAELRPEIDDNLHAQDVADYLVQQNLHDVTLVGHSYGGFPMTGAIGRAPDRIGCLIYLDAYVPKDGDTLYSQDPGFAKFIQQRVDAEGEGWKIPPLDAHTFFQAPDDIAWFEAHVTASPVAMYKTPLKVDMAAWERVPKGYVAFEQFKFFQNAGQKLQAQGGKYQLVHAGHMGVYSAPDLTADAILAVER